MSEKKLDLRVIKTRKAITNAFLNLLDEKDFDKITVQDISSAAMINRNTFYLHYIDKYDLMEHLCNANIERINESLNFNNNRKDNEFFITSLNNLFKTLEENIVFFKAVLKNNKIDFIESLKGTLKVLFINNYEIQEKNVEQEINLEYILSGLVGVISLWINNYENIPVSTIVNQLNDIYLTLPTKNN